MGARVTGSRGLCFFCTSRCCAVGNMEMYPAGKHSESYLQMDDNSWMKVMYYNRNQESDRMDRFRAAIPRYYWQQGANI